MRDRFNAEPNVYGKKTIVLVDAVFQWCESLRGAVPVRKSLRAIADGLGAEAIVLSRIKRDADHGTKQICYDCRSPKSSAPMLERSFAEALIGGYLTSARPGTIWLRTVVELESDPALDLFHARRKFEELAIIPLSSQEGSLDCLEIHFATALSPDQHALLNMLAGTFSKSWASRDKGVFLNNLLNGPVAGGTSGKSDPVLAARNILAADNPARLSRAEYRVCLLLSRGLQVNGICRELEIAQPTLRTHLRNIYAKTSTANMPELLHILFRGAGTPALTSVPNVA